MKRGHGPKPLEHHAIIFVCDGPTVLYTLVVGFPIWLWVGVGFLTLAIVIQVAIWLFGSGKKDIARQVREASELGDFRTAGDLQMRHENFAEAARLYERGELYGRRARALLRCDEMEEAARAFTLDGDWGRAGEIYEELEDHAKAADAFGKSHEAAYISRAAKLYLDSKQFMRAGRLYERIGRLRSAAKAFARVENLHPPDLVVTLLEKAALALGPKERASVLGSAGKYAFGLGLHERAARAFESGGDLPRAAKIYAEHLFRYDLAAAILHELGKASEAAKMTQAAGGELAVLRARQERAQGRGDHELAQDLAEQAHRAQSKHSPSHLPPANGTAATLVGGRGRPVEAPAAALRYEIIEEVGRGGMGVVYRARDVLLDREVALKFAPEDMDPLLTKLLGREAQAAAQLSHPGIVTIYDVGKQEGREFIAMELIDGQPLDEMLEERGALSVLAGLELLEPVFEAVAFAHSAGVIHRDIKPPNIMRLRNGNIKVMDFGIAKRVDTKIGEGKTSLIAGTPAYMPPEQLMGHATPRSDLFALAATAYEVLTGEVPGTDSNPAYCARDYPSPRDRKAGIPVELSDIIMKCLAHLPEDRPQSVEEVLEEFRHCRQRILASLRLMSEL